MNLPTFTPKIIREVDQKVELLGAASEEIYLGQKWIGERWLGYIGRDCEPPLEGRWLSDGDPWRFVTDQRKSLDFKPGEPLRVYDGYWGERAYLVLAPLTWTQQEFEENGDRDHEHCGICWATIAADAPQYFRSSEQDVVCPSCYRRYVRTRSLNFIVPTPNKPEGGNGG